ncbi:hypothetical protein [Mariniblastus fucicola]|uniref:Uncharacterized protein n=1 Tax=Mariniblastus fucicola TaxID=980251 RepID=A0A5B9PBY4_9BACT|nr:hypothetical protein [Mariniblastus fucicola]QEG20621.1 hypothetical protein MFFC18_04710 [Mariniblastus fucicola]
MFQFPITSAAFLLMLVMPQEGVENLLDSPTQTAAKSSQAKPTDSAEAARIKAEVAEIMAIRQQLGGGISEQLKDLSLEMPNGKPQQNPIGAATSPASPIRFKEQLAKQAAQRPAEQFRDAPQLSTVRNSAAAHARWKENLQMAPSNEQAQATSAHSSRNRESIRHAARMLEEAAAVLEEAREYNQADKIRQTAGELWRAARNR